MNRKKAKDSPQIQTNCKKKEITSHSKLVFPFQTQSKKLQIGQNGNGNGGSLWHLGSF